MNYSSLLQDVLIPAGLKLGGYPDDVFVNMSDKEREEFECQICYMVLKDARQCDNHHYFCAPCIFSWSIGHGENHDKCPVCRTDSAYKTCPEVDERLSRKRVKCVEPTCEWRGFLRDFRSHGHGLELVGGKSEEILPDIIAQLPQHRPPTPPSFFFGIPLIPSHENMLAHAAAMGGRVPRYQQMRSHLQEGRDRLLSLMLTFSEVLDMRRRNIVQFHDHRENNRTEQMQEVHHLGERLGDVASALMFLLEEARTDMNQMHTDIRNLPDSPSGMSPLTSPRSDVSASSIPQARARGSRRGLSSPLTPLHQRLNADSAQSLHAAFNPSLGSHSPRTSSFPLIGNITPSTDHSSPRSNDSSSVIHENAPGVSSLASGVNSRRFTDTASRVNTQPIRSTRSTLGTVSDRILDSTPRTQTGTESATPESESETEIEEEMPLMSTRATISRYRRRMLRRQLVSSASGGANTHASSNTPTAGNAPVSSSDSSSTLTPSSQVQGSTMQAAPSISASNTCTNTDTTDDSDSPSRDWGTFTVSASMPSSGDSRRHQPVIGSLRGSAINESTPPSGDGVASSGLGTSSSSTHGRRNLPGSSQHSDLNRTVSGATTNPVTNRTLASVPSSSATVSTATASRHVTSSSNNNMPLATSSSRPSVHRQVSDRDSAMTPLAASSEENHTPRLLTRNQENNTGLLHRGDVSGQTSGSMVSSRAAVRRPSAVSRRTGIESSNNSTSVIPHRPAAGVYGAGLTRRSSVDGQNSNTGPSRRSTTDVSSRPGLHRRSNTDSNNSNNNPSRRSSTDVPTVGLMTHRRTNTDSSSRRLSVDLNPNPNRRTLIDPNNTISRSTVRRRSSNDSRITAKLNQKPKKPNS